jgi:hypothetical protein
MGAPDLLRRGGTGGAARPVAASITGDPPAFRANQGRPARRIAPLGPLTTHVGLGWASGLRRRIPVHGQELERHQQPLGRIDLVDHSRRYGLLRPGDQLPVDGRRGGRPEPQAAPLDPYATPGPAAQPVSPPQSRRQCAFIPLRRAHRPHRLGKLGPIAQRAVEAATHPGLAAGRIQYPVPPLEGGTVPDVLVVAAFQFGHPVADVVGVKATYYPLRASSFGGSLRRYRGSARLGEGQELPVVGHEPLPLLLEG